jgi:hypothetical protein
VSKIIGLDNGNGRVKTVEICKEQNIELQFPALLSRVEGGLDEAHYNYADNTGRYLVGDDAVFHGRPEKPSVDSSYISTNQYRIQTLFALSQHLTPTEKAKTGHGQTYDIVTGLPVEFYHKDKKALKEIIQGYSHPLVKIGKVKVVPQPFGALSDIIMNWDGEINPGINFDKKRVVVCDVGNGTIDGIEVVSNKIGDISHGRTGGISLMHDELYQLLNNTKDASHIRRSQIDQVVREGGYYIGPQFIEIKKQIDHTRKKMAEAVKAFVNETWDVKTLYRIIIVGGGAEVLRAELSSAFLQDQVLIPDDPALSNARGFAKIGQAHFKHGASGQ